MIPLITLFIVEAVLMLLAHKNKKFLGSLVSVNMILIAVFGAKLFSLYGHVSNVGNIFFASAIAVQAILYFRFGTRAVIDTVRMVFYSLVAVLLLSYTMSFVPVVTGNEFWGDTIVALTRFSPQIIAASFVAFFLSQSVLVLCLSKLRGSRLSLYTRAVLVTQTVDSLVFFPIAFAGGDFTEVMMVGFTVKVIVNILLTPLVLIFGKHEQA